MLVVLLPMICWCGVVAVGWSACTLLHMHAKYVYLYIYIYIYTIIYLNKATIM